MVVVESFHETVQGIDHAKMSDKQVSDAFAHTVELAEGGDVDAQWSLDARDGLWRGVGLERRVPATTGLVRGKSAF